MKTSVTISLVIAALAITGVGCKKRQPISQNLTGAIATGDHQLEQDHSLYDDYPIDVEQGWTVQATLRSSEFDTYLILIDPEGNRATFNDDDASLGGKGTDSSFNFVIPKSGVYHVYANAYQSGEKGAYTLNIQAGPAASITPPAAAPEATK